MTGLRMYVLVREDISIPTGKLLAQVGHAFIGLYEISSGTEKLSMYMNDSLHTKIALKAKNLDVIYRAQRECNDSKIPTYLVTDAGLTVFTEPTITVLGIGPCLKEEMPKYVQRLQLYI